MLITLFLLACNTPLPAETLAVEPVPLDASVTPDLARGQHLVENVLGCTWCHGPQLTGRAMVEGFPMGRLVAPNITDVGDDTDAWLRAIRHGVGRDGRKLILMPSAAYADLPRSDVASVVAWLQTLTPVDNPLPESELGPVGRMLVEDGEWPMTADHIDHTAPIPDDPGEQSLVQQGAHLARIASCMDCHAGGPGKSFGPAHPPSANLTPHEDGLASWTRDDFGRALQEGIRPDGRQLDSFMWWEVFAGMTDHEVDALWAYLQSLPPMPDR